MRGNQARLDYLHMLSPSNLAFLIRHGKLCLELIVIISKTDGRNVQVTDTRLFVLSTSLNINFPLKLTFDFNKVFGSWLIGNILNHVLCINRVNLKRVLCINRVNLKRVLCINSQFKPCIVY